jgi:hypothetical protein
MNRQSVFRVVAGNADRLIIKDVGPWDAHLSVTNDAEGVVRRLLASGDLNPEQRLFCWDSEGELGELLFENGEFKGFA